MRRVLALSLAGGIVLAGLAGRSAHGQEAATPTPVAVATVTPTAPPRAGQLIDRMMRAWQAAGSDHFTMSDRMVKVAGSTTTIYWDRQGGDVAWGNPPVFQMAGPTYQKKKTSGGTWLSGEREVQLFDQNLLAIRFGHQKWSCSRFFGYSALPGTPMWDETSPWGIGGKNLGLTLVNGIQAWHVRSSLVTPGPKGSKTPRDVTIRDYFASEVNYLPVKIHVGYQSWEANKQVTNNTTLVFSKFGETVKVSLPSACKKK